MKAAHEGIVRSDGKTCDALACWCRPPVEAKSSNLESSGKRVTSAWHCEACQMVHEFVGPTAFTLHGFRCGKCGHDNFIVKQPETTRELSTSEAASFDKTLARSPRRVLSATERLHNICDALSEQADESPFTREEWDEVDRQTVRMTNALKGLIDAVRNVEIEKGPWDSFIATPLESAYRALKHEDPQHPKTTARHMTADERAAMDRALAQSQTSVFTCPTCTTELAFEGDECGLCKVAR